MEPRNLIQVQGRGRVALGKLATADHYLARREPDGTIILEPAEVMSAAEAKLLADDRIMGIVSANLHDHGRLVERDRSAAPRQ